MECKTAERAAEAVMGEHDTDVAEALFVVSPAEGWAGRAEGLLPTCPSVVGVATCRCSKHAAVQEPGATAALREPSAPLPRCRAAMLLPRRARRTARR